MGTSSGGRRGAGAGRERWAARSGVVARSRNGVSRGRAGDFPVGRFAFAAGFPARWLALAVDFAAGRFDAARGLALVFFAAAGFPREATPFPFGADGAGLFGARGARFFPAIRPVAARSPSRASRPPRRCLRPC